MRALRLKRGEDRRLRAGHLWIFSNEVNTAASPLTDFAPGDPAEVLDAGGHTLGTAYVNPASLICARLVSRRPRDPLGPEMLRKRLGQALALRERLFSRPFYRLCHGEGDFLPGLILDRYNDILVAQFNTAGMDRAREQVLDALENLRPSCVVLRNDTPAREAEGLPRVVETPLGTAPPQLFVEENSLNFHVPFMPENGRFAGQKSGWFFDQRDNRREAARYARGAEVLDAFCYAGAFGVYAAISGARSVCFTDSSSGALAAALANISANVPDCAAEGLPGDASGEEGTLHKLREQGRRFDLVCLDPPAFIKRRKDAAEGLAAYRSLNALGADLLKDPGVLVTSSCSYHLSAGELQRCVTRAALRRGLHARILYQGSQAADHPVHPAMPESRYLTCLAVYIHKA
jgi:23S rRNA (cytosine1962-C5)-methyltransferase